MDLTTKIYAHPKFSKTFS